MAHILTFTAHAQIGCEHMAHMPCVQTFTAHAQMGCEHMVHIRVQTFTAHAQMGCEHMVHIPCVQTVLHMLSISVNTCISCSCHGCHSKLTRV